jgi:hypothetical protein
VNILYILRGDRFQRLHEYFSSYIATERTQNKAWADAAGRGPASERAVHARAIAEKEKALDIAEAFLQRCCTGVGRVYVPGAKLPSIFDRFKELGKETSYRTVYVALCSQAHNDAEDLLNEFAVKSTGDKGLAAKLEAETVGFSKFAVFVGLQYHLEAVVAYTHAFGLRAAVEPVGLLYDLALSLAATAAPGSDVWRELSAEGQSGAE